MSFSIEAISNMFRSKADIHEECHPELTLSASPVQTPRSVNSARTAHSSENSTQSEEKILPGTPAYYARKWEKQFQRAQTMESNASKSNLKKDTFFKPNDKASRDNDWRVSISSRAESTSSAENKEDRETVSWRRSPTAQTDLEGFPCVMPFPKSFNTTARTFRRAQTHSVLGNSTLPRETSQKSILGEAPSREDSKASFLAFQRKHDRSNSVATVGLLGDGAKVAGNGLLGEAPDKPQLARSATGGSAALSIPTRQSTQSAFNNFPKATGDEDNQKETSLLGDAPPTTRPKLRFARSQTMGPMCGRYNGLMTTPILENEVASPKSENSAGSYGPRGPDNTKGFRMQRTNTNLELCAC